MDGAACPDVDELNAPENQEFLSYLRLEINEFFKINGNSDAVMLLPPFNSYKRMLTHHLVELDYTNIGLSTFSIGAEPRRRTVVCLSSLRKHVLSDDANDSKNNSKPRSSSSFEFKPKVSGKAYLNVNETTECEVDPPVQKRPDRQRKVRKTMSYYVPPHLRKQNVDQNEPVVKKNKKDDESVEGDVDKNVDELCDPTPQAVGGSEKSTQHVADSESLSSSSIHSPQIPDVTSAISKMGPTNLKSPCFDERVSLGERCVPDKKELQSADKNEVWDPQFIGKGTCSLPDLFIPILDDSELGDISKEVGKVKIVETKGPKPEESTDDNKELYVNSSMIEIYDLPEGLRTDDLASIFQDYHHRGFRLRWVDDFHALGVFSSSKTAEEALASSFSSIKIRPISEGTPLSQEVARNVVLPSSFRPKTCSSLAKRLLSGALGLKVTPLSPEEREAHRVRLQERKKTPS